MLPSYSIESVFVHFSGEKRLGEDSKEIEDLIQLGNKKKKKKHVRNKV